jgi:hypothetical protein
MFAHSEEGRQFDSSGYLRESEKENTGVQSAKTRATAGRCHKNGGCTSIDQGTGSRSWDGRIGDEERHISKLMEPVRPEGRYKSGLFKVLAFGAEGF